VEETRRRFEAFSRGDIFIVVPALAYYEVSSNILRASRQRRLSADAANDALESLFYLGLAIIDPSLTSLIPDAYVTAREQNCGLYDAIFLVVSRSIGAPLITADESLFNATRRSHDVLWIGDAEVP
jgi:predicted nucleic acid-binding protein